VDLGKDTVNYIHELIIKNRADCCGGRLKQFYVEVLDSEKNVVFSEYHTGHVGNGSVRTFTPPAGTTGRFSRIRYEDTRKDCLHIGEFEIWGYPIELPANPPEIIEMALDRPATASSVLQNNALYAASKSNDGDIATIHHSECGHHPWWKVDLGVDSFVQDVVITNRVNCCGGRLQWAKVEILDSAENVVESRNIVGAVGNGKVVQKVFNEDTSFGRYVKVSLARNECLHMAEVAVNGYHTMAMPTSSPTLTLINLATGKTATQSSTYNAAVDGPEQALDGNDNTFTHTRCWTGINQWWRVDLEAEYTIASLKMVNRLNCCGGRLHDFTIDFLGDDGTTIVHSIFNAGQLGNWKKFSVGFINARYVQVTLGDKDCLQLGEIEVWGF